MHFNAFKICKKTKRNKLTKTCSAAVPFKRDKNAFDDEYFD
jgi:hypothetical protein